MNIATLLAMAAEGFGDRVAVGPAVDGLSYSRLRDLSAAAATQFQARAVTNIALLAANSTSVPVSLFGAAWAGLAYCPVNDRLPPDVIGRLLERLEPVAVVGDRGLLDTLPYVPSGGVIDVVTLLQRDGESQSGDPRDVSPDDVAVRLFTSGTSADPKSALLRHRHLLSYVLSTVDFASSDESEAALLAVPPFHIAGVSGVITSVYRGRRVVPLPRFDAEAWLGTVATEGVTHALLVPTMLARIIDHMEPADPRVQSLRLVSYGGARMPKPVIERAMAIFPSGTGFVNAYGLTETSSTVSVLGPEEHRQAHESDDPAVRDRLQSVGRPISSIEISIRSESGETLGPGMPGEIWVRGDQVSGEYDNGTATKDDAGWLRSGDRGWLDNDGYLFIAGRLDDVIIKGGENISATEIEDTILMHPAVAQAAVVGLPDDEWGEAVAAAVVGRPSVDVDPEDLKQWVRQRLGSLKTPELVVVRPSLPETATGKLIRRTLRADLERLCSEVGEEIP